MRLTSILMASVCAKRQVRVWRAACTLVLGLFMVLAVSAQAPPSLTVTYLVGGAGNQNAYGLAKSGSDIYLGGNQEFSNGWLVKVNAADGTPVWAAVQSESLSLNGLAIGGANIFAAGVATPPGCGAIDGSGGTEGKLLFASFRTADGGRDFCGSFLAYGYRGHENYYSITGGSGVYYAAGWAEQSGYGGHRYIIGKYDAAGTLLSSAVDPLTFSFALAVAMDGSGIYTAGFRRDGSWHGLPELPFLVKVSTSLSEQWRATIDAASEGARGTFYGVTASGPYIYAVGNWTQPGGNVDYLVAKFAAADGTLIWRSIFGGLSADYLFDVAVSDARLFVAGETASEGSGGTDAVLTELNPATGTVLNSSLFGGAGNETIRRIAGESGMLWLAGSSNSFATPAGNAAGQYDALLLKYTVVLTVSIDIKPGSSDNSVNLGANGTVPVAILSTAAFDATTVTPTTVTLAGASVALRGKGTPNASVQDVNGDGLPDLVVHVSTEALQLSAGDTEAILTGQTFSGQPIQGTGTVRIVP
jgi:hypothetical protein